MAKDFFYDNELKFELHYSINDEQTYKEIIEPIDFNKIESALSRDKDYYGFTNQFITDNIQLKFSAKEENSGADIITSVYNEDGADGVIYFKVLYYSNLMWNQLEYMRLNLQSYKLDKNGNVTCQLEIQSFGNLFRTRFDTKIDPSSRESIDGVALLPEQKQSVKFISQKIYQQYQCDSEQNGRGNISSSEPKDCNLYSFIFPTENLNRNTFEDSINHPVTVIQNRIVSDSQEVNPTYTDRPIKEFLFAQQLNYYKPYYVKTKRRGDVNINIAHNPFNFTKKTNSQIGYGYVLMAIESGLDIGDPNESNGFKWENLIKFENAVQNGKCRMIVYNDHNIIVQQDNQTGTYIYETEFNYNYVFSDIPENFEVYFSFCFWDYSSPNFILRTNAHFQYISNAINITQSGIAPDSNINVYMLNDVMQHTLEAITDSPTAKITSSLIDTAFNDITICNGYEIRNIKDNSISVSMKEIFDSLQMMYNIGYTVSDERTIIMEHFDFFFQEKLIYRLENPYDIETEHTNDFSWNEFEIGYSKYGDEATFGTEDFNTLREYINPIKTFKKKLSKKSEWIASGYRAETQRVNQYKEQIDDSYTDDENTFVIILNQAHTSTSDDIAFISGGSNVTGYNILNYRISPARCFSAWQSFLNSVCAYTNGVYTKCQLYKNNGDVQGYLTVDYSNGVVTPLGLIENEDFLLDKTRRKFYPTLFKFKHILDFDVFIHIRDAYLCRNDEQYWNGHLEIVTPIGIQKVYMTDFKYNFVTRVATIDGLKINILK